MLSNKFTKRLKHIRNTLKMSQKNFSNFLDIPLKTYQNWEQGHSIPDIDHLISIADKLHVSIDWLLGRENCIVIYGNNKDILKKILKENTS